MDTWLFDLANPDLWWAVGASLLCGFGIGLERQLRGHAAGLRTCALITLGSMLFARLGLALYVHAGQPVGDPTRMAGQVVVGVGFLGAGVIFNHRRIVHGMTTAAVVWLLSALGALAGVGAPGTAVALAAVALLALVLVGLLEGRSSWLRHGLHANAAGDPAAPRPRRGRGDD
jgi:putative Mg2+ transporter-C (MgtC) family protein